MDVQKPVETEEKPTGRKRAKKETSSQKNDSKKPTKTINSADVTEKSKDATKSNDKKSINSGNKGQQRRGRGRPRKNLQLPTRHRGKPIKNAGNLDTSEDTETKQDMIDGMAALERLRQKKKDQEAAIFASMKAQYNLRSGRNVNETDKSKDELDNKKTENPEEDKSIPSENQGRGRKRLMGTSSKNVKKDEEIENPELSEKSVPHDSNKSKPNKGKQTIEEVSEVLNTDNLDLSNTQNEDNEENNKSGSKKETKESNASKHKNKEKPKSKKRTEKPTEDGRQLRMRTINPAAPSTSNNEDDNEVIEPEEFTCKICGKTFKDYNQIKAHKLLCTKLKKKYACSVCSKGFTQKSMLEDHFDYLHTNNPKKYRCKPCNKTFEQKKGILRT